MKNEIKRTFGQWLSFVQYRTELFNKPFKTIISTKK